MATAAVRTFGTCGVTSRMLRRPSMRAWGRNSSARNRMIVGTAVAAVLHRPAQFKKFSWNDRASPMRIPPT